MSLFDGNFDMGDAFTLGATAGFAEESMRKEEEGESDAPVDIDLTGIDLNFTYSDLRRLAKSNPRLFKAVLLKSIELQLKYEKALADEIAEAELQNDHELIALAKTEKLMEK